MALRMNPDQAATVALKGLAFLVNSPEDLERFLLLTGARPETLRERADEPEFLTSVLAFLLSNEELLTGFSSDFNTDVRTVHMAHHVLAGG